MDDIYKNIEEYNPNKKNLIAFNDMIWFMKIPNKSELQQISFNYLSDIDCQDFM